MIGLIVIVFDMVGLIMIDFAAAFTQTNPYSTMGHFPIALVVSYHRACA